MTRCYKCDVELAAPIVIKSSRSYCAECAAQPPDEDEYRPIPYDAGFTDRVGTVSVDPATGECVMAPDFAGDEELRWSPDGDVTKRRHLAESADTSARSGETAGRYFESGAYRDADDDKWDYEGFLSPLVLEAYAAYMHRHRLQSDGQMRDSDNWQRGIPPEQYVKSAWRHFMDLWKEHRGYPSRDGIDEALGGLLFNICGFWHERLKGPR